MISFRSKVSVKILDYYFLNPDAQAYINELARLLELDPKNVERKLKEFESKGLFQSEFRGKQRYFFLAKKSPLLVHYRQIFLKTFGLEKRLRGLIENIPGVKEAYIYGSYARGKMDSSSDVDLLVVGSHSVLGLQRSIAKLQKDLGREINIVNFNQKEFERRKKNEDPFISNIFNDKTIRLL